MPTNVEQRPDEKRPGPERSGRGPLAAFAIGAPIVLILVVAAGFTHPWNPGGGIAEGSYTRDYSQTRQIGAGPGRCLQVTLTGTLSATYRSPAWSLGGPGWTSPRLTAPGVRSRITTACAEGGVTAPSDAVQLTQYWATQTCDEPERGDWQQSARLKGCDQDLVAGISAGSTREGDTFEASFGDLGWQGTTYGDSVCLDGMVVAQVEDEGSTVPVGLDGYRVCLDPASANRS